MITTVKDTENSLEARVNKMTNGNYSVSLVDTDADLTVPTIRIFKAYDLALKYARKITSFDAGAAAYNPDEMMGA